MRSFYGFTLVELVVVIAILGILAAIAVPRLLGFQTRAQEQADKQSAVQVRNAIALLHANGELEMNNNGTFTIYANTAANTSAEWTNGVGTTAGLATAVGIGTGRETATPANVTGAGDVPGLVHQLTGNIKIMGTKNIVITVQNDGTVEVTTP